MDRGDRIWKGDWREKINSRAKTFGCNNVSELLAKFPGEPYVLVAARLGDDIAALQLERMQFGEAATENEIRLVAMDSLVRDLHRYLTAGWSEVATADFAAASAGADWLVRLRGWRGDLATKGEQVWKALESLRPQAGWSPSNTNDPLILAAFASGWPQLCSN